MDDGIAVFGDVEGEEFQLVLNIGDAAAHEALGGIDGAIRMVDQFLSGGVAYDQISGGRQGDNAGNELGIFSRCISAHNDFRAAEVHPRDQTVGGAEVDADHLLRTVKLYLEHSFCRSDSIYICGGLTAPAGRQEFPACYRHPIRRTCL